ncbi:hypothetical protein JKF63_00257 [Porcisia hertigi]|uniref:GP-PDE domain-containing protein n=1 Tax=Porcisia hertigi TaxID=2761500 RepID=A0A836I987_9TRYP|nr:hypothetical protein JKF63_00257 [Porcisia hertigi]
MNVCVYGLSSEMLEGFFVRECTRSAQPLLASSASELRFGLVAAAESMGAWGLAWPLGLERCDCQCTPCVHAPNHACLSHCCGDGGRSAVEHYVAQVRLTCEEVSRLHTQHLGAEGLSMPCRLVILEEALFRAPCTPKSRICATPGTVIAGVDQRYSQPSSLCIRPFESSADTATVCDGEAPQWSAVMDVRQRQSHSSRDAENSNQSSRSEGGDAATACVCFGSTSEQFALLYNLPALPPRPVFPVLATAPPGTGTAVSHAGTFVSVGSRGDGAPVFCGSDPDGGEGVADGTPGPLLSLTFYANDPSQPFDQAAWQSELTSHVSEVLRRRLRETADGTPSTTLCHVTDVRPIPVEGSSWCFSHLPMPVVLGRQMRDVRLKHGTAVATSNGDQVGYRTASHPEPSALSVSTVNSPHTGCCKAQQESLGHSARGEAPQRFTSFSAKGWCVRPLQTIQPVLPQTGDVDGTGGAPLVAARTQHAWTCLLNLRELKNFGIEVTVRVPYVVDGAVLSLQGSTVLFSGMLQSTTSGTILLPVHCTAPAGAPEGVTSLWAKLYVQYLLVSPLEVYGQRGPLEIVRSLETFASLTVPTLIGHRGLGKTYTRSPPVCGGAPLIIKCSENSIPSFQAAHARRCDMIEFDVMLSADRVPVVIHDPVVELMVRKRGGMRASQGQAEYTPVRAAVHKLSYTQLRDLYVQCCKTLGRSSPAKDLLIHHWESLLWWARNRQSKLLTDSSSSSSPSGVGGCSSAQSIDSALMRVDFPNGVPLLREVLEQTPPSLRFNIEVKYPFQPDWDSNLFLQSDAFEVNTFVDAILNVVFQFGGEREIIFSSFDPNVCLVLSLKQSRYAVLFLSDTKELRDLKDYRSFYVEGAIQFAAAHHLAGVSINAETLLSPEDEAVLPHIPEAPLHGSAERGPVTAELFRADDSQHATPTVPPSFGAYGRAMVAEMHHRQLKVWTWGDKNSHLYFAYTQVAKMQVDGVIGDRMPVFPSAS